MSSAAFREHPSGLVVPESVPRSRRVVLKAGCRTYDNAMELFDAIGIRVKLACERNGCGPLIAVRADDGGMILRCDCTDRVFTRAN